MWNTEETNVEESFEGQAVIRFKEDKIFVDAGDNFVEEVINSAKFWEIGKFKVILNGSEIENDEAPSFFEEGDVVTLVKFEDPA